MYRHGVALWRKRIAPSALESEFIFQDTIDGAELFFGQATAYDTDFRPGFRLLLFLGDSMS